LNGDSFVLLPMSIFKKREIIGIHDTVKLDYWANNFNIFGQFNIYKIKLAAFNF